MTEELEIALRRTLNDAAERAPKAPPGIGLEPQPCARPAGYSRMALVAAAVAVAVGGATLGGRTLLSGEHSSGTTAEHPAASPALHRPKKVKVPPIEQVWPKAAHRIPNTLPNGRALHPQALIDDHTLLITTESSFEKSDALYAYDLRTHHTRLITQVITPTKRRCSPRASPPGAGTSSGGSPTTPGRRSGPRRSPAGRRILSAGRPMHRPSWRSPAERRSGRPAVPAASTRPPSAVARHRRCGAAVRCTSSPGRGSAPRRPGWTRPRRASRSRRSRTC